jgi:hypothetical protein
MGIHETIRAKPAVAATVALLIIITAAAVIAFELKPNRIDSALANSRFFSDDDGRTWFIDSKGRIPPFDHDGKTAYGAEVFRCGDGSFFVAYLEKFSDKQKADIETQLAAHPEALNGLLQSPMEIKKPGDSTWLIPPELGGSHDSQAYGKTLMPVCPKGTIGITHVAPTDAETGAIQ